MTDLRQRVSDRLTVLREWRSWMEVEAVDEPDAGGQTYHRLEVVCGPGPAVTTMGVPLRRPLICLDDPATVGILADLVRRRWPYASTVPVMDSITGEFRGWFFDGDAINNPASGSPGEAWALAYLAVTEGEIGQE